MARQPRRDTPGSWHHVMNRATARRSLFETRSDIRFFLACAARAVRRGQIEVHAWCVLTTHFHLLVRSPRGELSRAMRRIQNEYVRHFNRQRRRDGPLVRGRFRSKPVDSLRYRQLLVRYIDFNPVQAGLCGEPSQYPWGSARQYATRRSPRWLSRDWVESWVADLSGSKHYDPAHYPRSLDTRAQERLTSIVTRRLEAHAGDDELDSLLGMATPEIRQRLRRRALLADGGGDQATVSARSVTQAIDKFRAVHGRWQMRSKTRSIDCWNVLHAGLLPDLASATFVSTARSLGVSSTHASRLQKRHRQMLVQHDDYARMASRVVRSILDQLLRFELRADASREVE